MPYPTSPPRRRALAALLTALCISLMALALGARVWLSPATAALPSPAAPRPPGQPTRERVEAELITVRPSGFDPAEIERPRGRFLLAVENRSGVNDLELRLDREDGGRLREAQTPRGRLRWSEVLDLPPGRYVLTEAAHPEWACRVTITSN